MAFGPALARLRRSRGLSQEVLADAAGLSQRHVSFLETGRARPGQRSLAALIAALALRGWEQRTLVDALAPQPPAGTETPEAPDPALVTLLAERLSPWPAYAFRPDGTLLAANRALGRLLETAAPGENLWAATAPAGGPNIYDLVFHPAGLGRWLENPEAVIPETLRRLRIEAAQTAPSPRCCGGSSAIRRCSRWRRARISPHRPSSSSAIGWERRRCR